MTFDPLVAAALGASAAMALLGPPAAALLFRRATKAPWAALGAGALTFFVSQVVLRLPWQVGIGVWKKDALAADPVLLFAWVLFSCFTAGLFEETGRYVAFRKLYRAEHSWRSGVMFGLGHGGLEAVLLVGLSLAVLRAATRGGARWYWAAVGFHAVSNLAGVEAARHLGPYVGEAVIALFALAALAFVFAERRAERERLVA